eukprot:scaffold345_cov134-Cylindrotheca_fusiformis.AAC.5
MESKKSLEEIRLSINEDDKDETASQALLSQQPYSFSSQPGIQGNSQLLQLFRPLGLSPSSGLQQVQAFNQQIPMNPFLGGGYGGSPTRFAMDPLYFQHLMSGNPRLIQSQNSRASLNRFSLQTSPRLTMNAMDLEQPTSFPQIGQTPGAQEVQRALATLRASADSSSGPAISHSPATLQVEQERQSISRLSSGSHGPVPLHMDCDDEALSEYQCLLRKQIELFEATFDDVQWNAQGRNKSIAMGQVGIRCRHCSRLATWARARGAVYYSTTLNGLYQAAQNMAKNHLCLHCRLIPSDVRTKLLGLRDCKRRAAGGKSYWAEGARVLGVYEAGAGLRFRNSKTGLRGGNLNEIENAPTDT